MRFEEYKSKRLLKSPEGNFWHYRNPSKKLTTFIDKNNGLIMISCFTKSKLDSINFMLDINGVINKVNLKKFVYKKDKTLMNSYYFRVNPKKNHIINILCNNENAYFRVFINQEEE